MTDMPAKIWAQNEHPPFFNKREAFDSTPYIRADLVEPLVEALRRSREAVNAIVLSTHSVSFDADLRAIDAALQAYEAVQPANQAGARSSEQSGVRHDHV